jgi:AhpD family alkylhydroperoxidase
MARQVRHVRPVAPAGDEPRVHAIAAEITRDFGAYVPPFSLHASAPDVLAACWTMLRECLVPAHVDRGSKERVAAAVSRLNACVYCVDAHTAALHATGDAATADALAAPSSAAAKEADPIVAWAAATRSPGHAALVHPPFDPAQAPELIGMALSFHYINRMVMVFLRESPLPFRDARLKALARRMMRPIVSGMVGVMLKPGAALAWLPEAPLPDDLAWARPHPTIAAAFARAAASFERSGAAVLPDAVRTRVHERIAHWDGDDPGLGRGWLEPAVAGLAREHHAAARLALLTALAPFQIDDAIITDFRRTWPDDAALVAATAWASFQAARHIGTWLTPR